MLRKHAVSPYTSTVHEFAAFSTAPAAAAAAAIAVRQLAEPFALQYKQT
jgi:hypothetical protein